MNGGTFSGDAIFISPGLFHVSGGTVQANSFIAVGFNRSGDMVMDGGLVTASKVEMLGGTLTLNGGVLATGSVTRAFYI